MTSGCETQEMILRRNSMGQLGFHVTHEGIVTDVESYAFAWQVGLRHNFRIVEICKVAIATLDLDQVTDLLKTSITVSVTVLPPNPDNSPRRLVLVLCFLVAKLPYCLSRGCNLTNCSYLTPLTNGSQEGEYENISGLMERNALLSSNRRKRVPMYPHRVPPAFGHPGSQSTPVSPDHMGGVSARGPMRKQSTLKASPTSAFSTLTPAVSCSEFSDAATRLGAGPSVQSHHYYSHHTKQFGSNLIKTRSEMSLTNASPPPGSYSSAYSSSRRYPSPSRSHSQHFGKVYKPSPMFMPSTNRPGVVPAKPPAPASGYFSDSSSVQDVWSLPSFPNPASLPNPVLAARSTRPSPSTSSSAFHSLERKDSHFSRTGPLREPPPYPPSIASTSSHASSFAARTKSPRGNGTNYPSTIRSASDRLRVKSGSTKSSNSSCNGSSSSTLQEDLLKLISPEYRAAESHEVSSSSGADTASTTQYSTPYSSLERPKVNGQDVSEDIVTMSAKPAHVVASVPASPTDGTMPVAKPPRSQTVASFPPAFLKEDNEIDWPGLVETATRAMANSKDPDSKLLQQSLSLFNELGAKSAGLPPDSVHRLEQTVEKLQTDLMREQEANARLKEENHRLQEESQTAAAQLRKFTQWFFANVNAK